MKHFDDQQNMRRPESTSGLPQIRGADPRLPFFSSLQFLFPFLLHYFATIWEQFRGYRGDRRDRRQHWCQEFIAVILISDQKSGNQEFGSNAQLLGHVAIFISLDGEDSWERVVINFYCRVGTRHLIINNLFSVAATKSVEFKECSLFWAQIWVLAKFCLNCSIFHTSSGSAGAAERCALLRNSTPAKI